MFPDRVTAFLTAYADRKAPEPPMNALRGFLTAEGFGILMAREMRNPFDDGFENALEWYDGPDALRARWMGRRDALHDIGMMRCRTSDVPVRWSVLRSEARGPALRIFEDLTAIGLTTGVSMAHVPLDRPPVFVSIAGDIVDDLSDDDLLSLFLAVTHCVTLWLAQNPNEADGCERLSPREVEILAASSVGLAGKPLADTLGITPNTIQSYLRSIRTKLGARTMPHAVQIAVSKGLIAT